MNTKRMSVVSRDVATLANSLSEDFLIGWAGDETEVSNRLFEIEREVSKLRELAEGKNPPP